MAVWDPRRLKANGKSAGAFSEKSFCAEEEAAANEPTPAPAEEAVEEVPEAAE